MLTNYHTHTFRCHHADGAERDYTEMAIRRGFKALGFSVHSPYIFNSDYYSGHRMSLAETGEYVSTIRNLADEYKDSIELLVGYEMEYYPDLFSQTVRFVADFGCDYLILGQHFVGNEDAYSGKTSDLQRFDRYINQTIEGLETGLFTYLCHPDLCLYTGDQSILEKGYLKLCEAAKKLDIPLELNMYGLVDGRHYPNETFFKIAASVGNTIVAGCDAHTPSRLNDPQELKDMEAFAARCGVKIIELSVDQVLARKSKIK